MWKFYKTVKIGHIRRLFLDYFKSKFVFDEQKLDVLSLPIYISLNSTTFKFYP